jgi:hypothetical protein
VVEVNQVTSSIIAGCVVSCGAVLVVAGASKLYRGVRGVDGATAIRRALHMPRRQWKRLELAAGGVECALGVLVCSQTHPVVGGGGLASSGAAFCALLGYVRIARIPGDCGCIKWRGPESRAATVTWRAIARSGMLFAAGVAAMVFPADAAGASYRGWFTGGMIAGATVLVALSIRGPVRTPVCRRPLWRPVRVTLRALASHETFAAMAASAGPFGPQARYRRTGCTDEFWFTSAAGPGHQAVVFHVSRAASGGRLAVHASLRDGRTPGPATGGKL